MMDLWSCSGFHLHLNVDGLDSLLSEWIDQGSLSAETFMETLLAEDYEAIGGEFLVDVLRSMHIKENKKPMIKQDHQKMVPVCFAFDEATESIRLSNTTLRVSLKTPFGVNKYRLSSRVAPERASCSNRK